jgi:glycosyltransferase involved in cell wall biosynthesis
VSEPPKLSLAAPCYNESEGITEVTEEWNAVLDGFPAPSEIVLCNDGSTDGTAAVLERLQGRFERLRVVSFDKNGGYGRALSAAIDATRGEFVATLDSDGQFDARDALALLRVLEERNLDCVTGFRRKKQDRLVRVLADRALNLIVRSLFRLRLRDTNCALKVARGEVLRGG